jgi:hypothetical protein
MPPKRHHYVPRFLLRRFSCEPTADNPLIWRLDKESGKSSRSNVTNEAVISHYYRIEEAHGLTATYIENVLSMIEGDASPLVAKLVDGHTLPPAERVQLALFVWIQFARTPLARTWRAFAQDHAGHLVALKALTDVDHIQQVFEQRGESKTPEEIDVWRFETMQQLEDGSLTIVPPPDLEVLTMFLHAEEMSLLAASQMSWLGLRAPAGHQFILSDHPVAVYDPAAAGDAPVAWQSSPTVEVTLPLDPSFCLLLTHGSPTYQLVEVAEDDIREINLRTYAWAHWTLYGATAQAVQQVRAVAKKQKRIVASLEPRPPQLVVAERFVDKPDPFKITVNRPPARGTRSRRRD